MSATFTGDRPVLNGNIHHQLSDLKKPPAGSLINPINAVLTAIYNVLQRELPKIKCQTKLRWMITYWNRMVLHNKKIHPVSDCKTFGELWGKCCDIYQYFNIPLEERIVINLTADGKLKFRIPNIAIISQHRLQSLQATSSGNSKSKRNQHNEHIINNANNQHNEHIINNANKNDSTTTSRIGSATNGTRTPSKLNRSLPTQNKKQNPIGNEQKIIIRLNRARVTHALKNKDQSGILLFVLQFSKTPKKNKKHT